MTGSNEPNGWSVTGPARSAKLKWLIPLLLLVLVLPIIAIVSGPTGDTAKTTPPDSVPGPTPERVKPSQKTVLLPGKSTPLQKPLQAPVKSTPPEKNAQIPEKTARTPEKTAPAPAKNPRRPTVDCYGDSLPEGALARMGSIRFQTGQLRGSGTGFNKGAKARMAFSPDGRFLATNITRLLVIWDRDGRRHAEIDLPDDYSGIGELVFSPDSRLLLTSHYGQMVIAWDVGTGRKAWARDFNNYPPYIESAAFSPDGRRIAAGVSGELDGVAVLNAATGKVLQEIACDQARSKVDWFPDGKRLLVVSNSKARVIPLTDPTKAKVASLSTKQSFPCCLADEGRLIVLQDGDSYVRVFDAETFKQVLEVNYKFKVRGFDLDDVRKTLFVFVGEDKHKKRTDLVLVYDLPSRSMIRALEIVQPKWIRVGPPQPKLDRALVCTIPMPLVGSCALVSPDGQALVTADPGLNWWSALDGTPLNHRKRHASPIKRLIFDPSGQTLYALGGDVRAWDVKTGAHRATLVLTEGEKCLARSWTKEGTHFVQTQAIALSRDGRRLGYADNHGYLSTADTGGSQFSTSAYCLAGQCPCDRAFRGSAPPFLSTFRSGPLALMFSADEKELVTAFTGEIRFYPLKDGKASVKPRTLKSSMSEWRVGFARSPDNRWLVANAKKVHLYDLEKMEESAGADTRPSPTYYGGSVIFSPDGKELILGVDWKTDTVLRWRFQEEAYPWSKSVHSDGTEVLASSAQGLWATGVRMDRKEARRNRWIYGIKVAKWGADGWLREFRGHRFRVTALAFSPDGRYLASGDEAGEILIWDTQAPAGPVGAPAHDF